MYVCMHAIIIMIIIIIITLIVRIILVIVIVIVIIILIDVPCFGNSKLVQVYKVLAKPQRAV